jgi:predicted lipoprotein with Yx(FWY)xxD motif
MSSTRLLAGLMIAVTLVAACSASGGSPVSTTAPVDAPVASGGATAAPVATVQVGTTSSSGFGAILAGPDGMTLYTYSGDSAGTSACTGSCAAAWPPLTVPSGGQPSAGDGVTGSLTTLTRADGSVQVAYEGRPLYYWQGDARPGDITGDGVDGFSVAKASGAGAPATSVPSSTGGRYGY